MYKFSKSNVWKWIVELWLYGHKEGPKWKFESVAVSQVGEAVLG